MATLTPRARRILLAAVSEYIATGEPVASRSLARRLDLHLSPASIRAVFADLESEGYLHKPHTSAGRVPTEAALRLFAEALMATPDPASGHDAGGELERRYSAAEHQHLGLDVLMRLTGKVLAELTGAAAVVRMPRSDGWVLRDIKFIGLRPQEVLAVIVATNGAVENRVMRVEDTPSRGDLERVNNLLQARIEGRTLSEVRAEFAAELEAGRARTDGVARRALEMGHQALAGVATEVEVLVEGTAQLLERPEFASADRTRQLVRTLEDHERLLTLLDRTLETRGLQVLIGSADGEMGSQLSLVAAPFGSGAVGVLGSTRMDYSSVVPLVRQTAQSLTRILGERGGGGRP